MKKGILFLLSSLLILSCNSSDKKGKKAQVISTKNKQIAKDKPVKSDFDLNAFPKEWTRLTKTDSGLVVFNSCDGGNKLITLTSENDQFKIKLHGQQEDFESVISKSEIVDSAYIELRVGDFNDSQFEIYRVEWIDEAEKLCKWTTYITGLPPQVEVLVSNEHLTKYDTYTQPCIECFTQEMCDQMELMK